MSDQPLGRAILANFNRDAVPVQSPDPPVDRSFRGINTSRSQPYQCGQGPQSGHSMHCLGSSPKLGEEGLGACGSAAYEV